MAGADRFTRSELALVAAAAALVFVRVFGLSLVLVDFRAYGHSLGGSPVLVGTALGAYGLTMALMQLPLGMLSDRLGRRPVLLLGTGLFVAGSLACALAPSIGWLLAARLLQGSGAVASVALAAVGEGVPDRRRTTAMALVGIPAGAGFVLGLAAGPLLGPLLGVRGLFVLTAALGLAAGLPALRMRLAPPPPAPAPAAPAPGLRRTRGLAPAALALAAAGFAANYALTTAVFFLPERRFLPVAGMLLAALAAMTLATRAIDRRGAGWQPVVAGLAGLAVGAAWFVGAPAPWMLAGGALFFACHSTLSAVLPSQVSRVSGRMGGQGHGIQGVVASLGTFAAGPVAGALASRPGAAVVGVAVLCAAAGAFVVAARTPQAPASAAGAALPAAEA